MMIGAATSNTAIGTGNTMPARMFARGWERAVLMR